MYVKIALFQAGCTLVCESHFSQAVIYAGPPHAKTTIHEKSKNPQNQNPSSHPPSTMSTPQTAPLLGPWVIDPPLFGLGQRFRRRAGCHCHLFHPSRCCCHRRGTAAPEAGVGGSTAPEAGVAGSTLTRLGVVGTLAATVIDVNVVTAEASIFPCSAEADPLLPGLGTEPP